MERLRNGQELKDEYENLYIHKGCELLEDKYGEGITHEFALEDILHMNFTLIEENTIDEIEKLDTELDFNNMNFSEDIRIIANKVNKLVQTVNKLNKEIQELKEGKQC